MAATLTGPQLRLILRALLVGAGVIIERLQSSAQWNHAVISGAIVAGGLAAAEAFTPLNSLVGVGKAAPTP